MIAEQVARYLSAQGFGALGQGVFFGMKHETPDDGIWLRDVSAPVPNETQGHPIDQSGVQVMVRNNNSFTARTQCYEVYKLLASFRMDTFITGGNPVVLTLCQTPTSYIGADDKGRHEYTTTFTIRYDRI